MAHFEIDKVVSRSSHGYAAMVLVNGVTRHLRKVDGVWADRPNRQGVYNTYSGGGL